MKRLAKAISNSGICSRREAEKLILAGEVKIDDETITSPAINVTDKNVIEVSGKIINTNQNTRLWVYYKPTGLITSHKDTHGRETVFENLPGLPRVISIGRLDLNSEGLLLLTNSGDLARKFELPSSKLERVYKVRAYGDRNNIMQYCEGSFPCGRGNLRSSSLVVDKVRYNPKSIKLIKSGTTNSWFEVMLTEGKNREIRKIFEYFGLKVNRLIRIKYGPFLLGSLKPGQYIEQNLNNFKDLC